MSAQIIEFLSTHQPTCEMCHSPVEKGVSLCEDCDAAYSRTEREGMRWWDWVIVIAITGAAWGGAGYLWWIFK
jgi:predicted amidophosphoribosyltransferase